MTKTSLFKSSTCASAVLAALAAMSATSARAQLYWDTNGTSAGSGVTADGVWSGGNWTATADGTGAPGAYVSSSDVIFAAGSDLSSATITVDANQTINTLNFQEGAVTLNAATTQSLSGAVAGTSHITVAGGASATINIANTFNGTFNVEGSLYGKEFRGGGNTTKTGAGTATFDRIDANLTVAGGTLIGKGGKSKGAVINSGAKLRITGDFFDGTGRNLNVNAGGTFEMAGAVSDTVNFLVGAGTIVGEANTGLTVGAGNATSTFSGTIEGDLDLTKAGTGTFTFSGASVSTGNITVNGGTFTLADAGSLTFYIGADGVSNFVDGAGTANFNGDFNFDLSGASLVDGNRWSIVSSGLAESFGAGFGVNGFTSQGSGIWTNGGFTFDQASGELSYAAVPEPSAFALLGGAVVFAFAGLRRRKLRAASAAV